MGGDCSSEGVLYQNRVPPGNCQYRAVFSKHGAPCAFGCREWACRWRKDSDFEERQTIPQRGDRPRTESCPAAAEAICEQYLRSDSCVYC